MEARHCAALSREGRRTTALLMVSLSLFASAALASTGFTTSATLSTTQSGPTLANRPLPKSVMWWSKIASVAVKAKADSCS